MRDAAKSLFSNQDSVASSVCVMMVSTICYKPSGFPSDIRVSVCFVRKYSMFETICSEKGSFVGQRASASVAVFILQHEKEKKVEERKIMNSRITVTTFLN
jgi:hypothetical protein